MAPQPRKDEPVPEPAPTPSDEPDWARRLRESIESLPGKLQATISDDDRSSIAEHVHGLFERSGAFMKPEPKPEPEGDPENVPGPNPEPKPEPTPERDSLAMRLFGRH